MFDIQVFSAFLIGGSLIALLSFLTEKAPRYLRGIIISFPSTIAISFIFIALSVGKDKLLPILPGVYYSLLGSICFTFTFTFIAQKFSSKTSNKKWAVLLTLLLASGVWIVFPIICSFLPQQISIALPVLVIGIFILQCFFTNYANKFPVCTNSPKLNLLELLFRAIFAGSIIATAVIISKSFNPYWGAILGGAYPAAFASQLMIFQLKYPATYLPSIIKNVPIGLLSLTVYSGVAAFCYMHFSILIGTIVAFLSSLFVSTVLAKLFNEKVSKK